MPDSKEFDCVSLVKSETRWPLDAGQHGEEPAIVMFPMVAWTAFSSAVLANSEVFWNSFLLRAASRLADQFFFFYFS